MLKNTLHSNSKCIGQPWLAFLPMMLLFGFVVATAVCAQGVPVPPGYELPVLQLPFPSPGPAERSTRLSFWGNDQVLHRINFDRSPREWADGLLTVTVGRPWPWEPDEEYRLYPLGVPGFERRAVACLPEVGMIVFEGPAEVSKSVRSIREPTFTLSLDGSKMLLSRAGDRRWWFEPIDFGVDWRLTRMELVRHPGKVVQLEYESTSGGRLAAINYANGQSVTFARTPQGISQISLPFGEELRFSRSAQGVLNKIELLRSTQVQSERSILRRFKYELDPSGRIKKFVNERGIVFDVRFDRQEIRDRAGVTAVLTSSCTLVSEKSTAFRRVTLGRDGSRLTVNGFFDSKTTLDRAADMFGFEQQRTIPLVCKMLSPAVASEIFIPRPSTLLSKSSLQGSYIMFVAPPDPATAKPAIPGTATWFGPENTTYIPQFDAMGRLSRATAKDKTTIEFVYDAGGELVESKIGKAAWVFGSDDWGRINSCQAPDGTKTSWRFDEMGNLSTVENKLPRARSSNDRFAPQEFDIDITTVDRNDAGRAIKINRPTGPVEQFHYDPQSGNLQFWEPEPNPQSRTNYVYDRLGRVVRIDYPRTHELQREEFEYQPNDTLAKRVVVKWSTNRADRAEYEYNIRGLLVTETVAGLGRTQYRYDDRARRNQIIHPDGTDTIYAFDELSRIISIRGSHQPPSDISYDEKGNRTVSKPKDLPDTSGRAYRPKVVPPAK